MMLDFVSREEAGRIDGGIAVVVDVMRAYTTAAWALELGADRVLLTDDTEHAVRIGSEIEGALLCKDREPDPRFVLTNSPAQIRSVDVRGRTIVQRTTAGTVGAMSARAADLIFCTGFVTAAATASAVRANEDTSVTFVVTGGSGRAEEDLACAEYIAALVTDPGGAPDPEPYVERARRSDAARRLGEAAAAGYVGVRDGDVDLCLEVDRFGFAMTAIPESDTLSLVRQGV